jgi:calcineurin-like phosphoesterase family protein
MTDSKTFIIADTHFGDSNILKYEKRPFADVGEMDDVLTPNRRAQPPKTALTSCRAAV